MLERNIPPLLRHVHNSSSVHETITKLVIVHPASSILQPAILIEQRSGVAGHDHQVLHVSPGEAGVGLQSQGADSSSNGSTGAGPGVFPRADLVVSESGVLINSHDALIMTRGATGEGGGQGGGALLQVPGFEPSLAGAGDGEGEDRVGVAITVAVINVSASVTTGPHKD